LLAPDEVADLRALVGGDSSIRPSPGQLALLADFIRYHASEGYRIKSLDYLVATDR